MSGASTGEQAPDWPLSRRLFFLGLFVLRSLVLAAGNAELQTRSSRKTGCDVASGAPRGPRSSRGSLRFALPPFMEELKAEFQPGRRAERRLSQVCPSSLSFWSHLTNVLCDFFKLRGAALALPLNTAACERSFSSASIKKRKKERN